MCHNYLLLVECLSPVAPANGTITKLFSDNQRTDYSLEYECNEGYTPSVPVISVCQNGMWNPDPRLVVCSKGMLVFIN